MELDVATAARVDEAIKALGFAADHAAGRVPPAAGDLAVDLGVPAAPLGFVGGFGTTRLAAFASRAASRSLS